VRPSQDSSALKARHDAGRNAFFIQIYFRAFGAKTELLGLLTQAILT
jgi:hypothetical protein